MFQLSPLCAYQGAMSILPTFAEQLSRARSDLRVGLPVRLTSALGDVLAAPAESIGADRFDALRSIGPPVLAITAWRAQTLKARAYDGDLARIVVPKDATPEWISSVADPADDLATPMKGPFVCAREGPADLHRAAILLVKSAHLLPAAVVVSIHKERETPGRHSGRLDRACGVQNCQSRRFDSQGKGN
ncbi:MAG: hypothetical protein AAFN59_11930, partial [Pseudomonadota bacterium]